MNSKKFTLYIIVFGMIFGITLDLVSQQDTSAGLTGPYLGQKPPGMTPEIFAKGIVSTEKNELNCTFTPDGKEMCFTVTLDGRHTLKKMWQEGDFWRGPEIAPFSGQYVDVDPYISADGKRLYFSSKRPTNGTDSKDSDLWYVEKEKSGAWSQPIRLKEINTPLRHDYYTSISVNGTIYFSIFSEDGRTGNLYRSLRKKVGYEKPEKLPAPINSEYNEHDPYISPEEDYLIFSSSRPGGFGRNDIYISFRSSDGTWSDPQNMGEKINTEGYDYCPMVTHDRKYLFFTRSLNRNGDVYWVDAKIIDTFRKNK